MAVSLPARAEPPAFSDAGPVTSDTGHVLIAWDADGPVTLEIADDPDFADVRPLYLGANHAHFVSGLANGDYFLRLRSEDGSQSTPLELTVRHQSLRRALWLALVGAIVALAVVFVILRGERNE